MVYLQKDKNISSHILQKNIWVIDQILDFRAAQYVKSQMSKMSNVCFTPQFLPISGPNHLYMDELIILFGLEDKYSEKPL